MSRRSDTIKVAGVLAAFLLVYFVACVPDVTGLEGVPLVGAVAGTLNGLHLHYSVDADTFPQELVPNPGAYVQFPEVPYFAGVWLGSQVLEGEMTATQWIRDHTLPTDKFVADIGGAEAIMGMTTRVSLVGGDWANSPDPVRNMETAGQIYRTDDASEANRLARESGCTYVLMPDRRLNTGTFDNYANATKFADPGYFQLVYDKENVKIYRVLP